MTLLAAPQTTVLYPNGATLATKRYHGVLMQVRCRAGVMHLDVIDYRDANPLRPRGLRQYRTSRHPAPVYVVSGNFHLDQENMQTWLDVHANGILSRESN